MLWTERQSVRVITHVNREERSMATVWRRSVSWTMMLQMMNRQQWGEHELHEQIWKG